MKKSLTLLMAVAGLCTASVASAQTSTDPNCTSGMDCTPSSSAASSSAASNSAASSSGQPGQLSTPRRYAAEVGGGYAGALGGGLVGGGIGFASGLIYVWATDSSSSGIFTLVSIAGFTAIGTVIGATTALPYGVHWGGNATGANGSLGATYLGGAAGVAVGLGGYYLTQVSGSSGSVDALDIIGVVVLLTAPVVGSMVGYELSLDDSTETTVGTLSAPRPTVSISPNGDRGYVGLGWSF